MIKTLCILIFLYSPIISPAQTIADFFKMLPGGLYMDELDSSARSLLSRGEDFRPPINDSAEIVVYRSELDSAKSYLRIEASFESGQAGWWTIEMRAFKTNTGQSIVVFSVTGGAHNMYTQNGLTVYRFSKAKGLTLTEHLGLLPDVDVKEFMKPGTPAATMKKYEDYGSVGYDLGTRNNTIILRLLEDYPPGVLKKYLAGDHILFTWTGDRFVKGKPKFDQPEH
jgi:hypothetical protein